MAKLYFVHRKTGTRFEVIRFLKDTGEVVLKGPTAEFKEPYSKERFAKLGYVLEKENPEDAVE